MYDFIYWLSTKFEYFTIILVGLVGTFFGLWLIVSFCIFCSYPPQQDEEHQEEIELEHKRKQHKKNISEREIKSLHTNLK